MSLCLAAGALSAVLHIQAFTLAWTHSIEKIRWEEDWRVTNGRIEITEARIRGTGAGMEPPDDARLRNGIWHYRPRLAPLESVTLTHSPFVEPYEICIADGCRLLTDLLPGIAPTEAITLQACQREAGRE